MYLKRLSELYLPRFEIGVFLLLDILPDKANELCLPGFEIRVVLLLVGQSDKTMQAPSAPVWNQSFPSPKALFVRGTFFIRCYPLSLLTIREGVPLSATRGRGWSP